MRFFLRNAVWFPYFILVLIGYLPTYIYLSWLNKKGRTEEVDRIAAKVVPKWARKILKAAGITVEASGLENIPKGAVVFAANHQGYFDIPLLLGYLDRPYGFVAKVETKNLPVISGWMRPIPHGAAAMRRTCRSWLGRRLPCARPKRRCCCPAAWRFPRCKNAPVHG